MVITLIIITTNTKITSTRLVCYMKNKWSKITNMVFNLISAALHVIYLVSENFDKGFIVFWFFSRPG